MMMKSDGWSRFQVFEMEHHLSAILSLAGFAFAVSCIKIRFHLAEFQTKSGFYRNNPGGFNW